MADDDSDDEEQPWLEQMAALSAEQLAELGEDSDVSDDEDGSDYEDDGGSDDNDDDEWEEEEDAAAALAEEAAEAEAELEQQKAAAATAAIETAALEAARTLPISEFTDLESLMEATLRLVRAGAGSSAPPAASPPASGGHNLWLVETGNRSVCGVCGTPGAAFACTTCKVRLCNPQSCQCVTKHLLHGAGKPIREGAVIKPAEVPEFPKGYHPKKA